MEYIVQMVKDHKRFKIPKLLGSNSDNACALREIRD